MDEAGISSLPEHILHHILSLLPQEEAVRTCVLSKSWRHLVSTRPKFCLKESYFIKDKDRIIFTSSEVDDSGKEKFRQVLDKSLQVYHDQKLCIEDFSVSMSKVDPVLVSLLGNWIPKLMHDMGVKKFDLSFFFTSKYFVLPSVVFESESLRELHLETCSLNQINSIGNIHHLKTLHLNNVCIKEETFAKIMLSCSSIESLSLCDCKGFKTISMHNHHNLKSFELSQFDDSIEIYLPSTIGRIVISCFPNWFHHRNYFPGLTFLNLESVPLSNEWFDNLSRNFPCLEGLRLFFCNGCDEFQISSRSIKNLEIMMEKSTTKATIVAPSIKKFLYDANLSHSISIKTTSSEWSSQIKVSLDLDASEWFLKLSELVAEFSQSQISLLLYHYNNCSQPIEHHSDISLCCKMPVAVKRLKLHFSGRFYGCYFFSDLTNVLFRIIRPKEIKQFWDIDAEPFYHLWERNGAVEFLCRTLQLGSWEDERMSFWQHDLEEVSLEVKNDTGFEEWHPVQGTISWSEYFAAIVPSNKYSSYELRFRLKWRELDTSFG